MVLEIENFLSEEECNEIINLIDENNVRSSVAGAGSEISTTDTSRTSYTSNLTTENRTVSIVKQRIADFLKINIENGEPLQGQKYDVGQYFKPHHDYFTGDSYTNHCLSSGNRVNTAMIYLNDDFDGGGTDFPSFGYTVKPEKGKLVVWHDMKDGVVQPETLHEGMEVKSGTKYIVTSWWRENTWNGSEDTRLAKEYHESRKARLGSRLKTFSSHEDLPRFDETGFKVVKVPDDAWKLIQEMYNEVKDTAVEEVFDGKDSIIPGTGVTSEILNLHNVWEKRDRLHHMLQPIHEEFCGVSLTPTFIYGIRSYLRGAGLAFHKDRIETHHISSIIIVDKNLACGCKNKTHADDWPLDIQSHNGAWHQVYAEVGEMILYESATCEHGRNNLFGGTYFRNFFVHYKLRDWEYVR